VSPVNDSASGGYLAPVGTVTEDAGLEDQIQAAIVGITGLAGTKVRPAWQPDPPQKPAGNVDWCAYRIASSEPDWSGALIHHPEGDAGEGTDELQRHATIEVLCSFYGPNARGYAARLSDGMQVPQNMEALGKQGISFLEAGRIWAAPEFINNQWVRRQDITVRLRRVTSRTYPIRNVLSAEGEIVTDTGNENSWNTENE